METLNFLAAIFADLTLSDLPAAGGMGAAAIALWVARKVTSFERRLTRLETHAGIDSPSTTQLLK